MRRSILAFVVLGLVATGCKKKGEITEPPVDTTNQGPTTPPQVQVPTHVKEMVDNFNRVFFEFDAADLAGDSKAALDANVMLMQKHPDVKVQIQGHADERGTTDYNVALGQRRAEAVRSYMTGQGIAPSRLTLLSYGEEVPLDPSSNERAWSQNRRAEFVITWGGAADVQGTVQ